MNETFLSELQKSKMGLFDNNTKKSVVSYKAVDFTHLFNDCPQVIVKYAKTKRGTIAQLNFLYEAGEDLGSQVHYHLSETSAKKLSEDEVFISQCYINGCLNAYSFAMDIYINL